MTFDIACPHCRAEFTVSEQQIGKTARCKQCRETFIITNNEPIVRDLAQTEIENTPTASPTEIPKVEAIVAANT